MKIYKFDYQYDTHRNREWFDLESSHTSYYKENNVVSRGDFIKTVGIKSESFLRGLSDEYVGYKITEIEVKDFKEKT